MPPQPRLLMTDPAHFTVSYVINPWMRPGAWAADPDGQRAAAARASAALRAALEAAGALVEMLPAEPGLPDLVFPANAAVVLDRRAVMARFRHPERRGEEAPFLAAFRALAARGLLDEVAALPAGLVQEGAGDCLWDAHRGHFWAGYGPRSDREAAGAVGAFFGRPVVALELATERFYHLDTCFCPLSGGEVLYHPPAFAPAALEAIRARVPPALRLEAGADEAARFCVNAVNLDRDVVMAETTPWLRDALAARGYRVREVDLSPFLMAGGGAFCMTLRLDRRAGAPAERRRAGRLSLSPPAAARRRGPAARPPPPPGAG